MRNFSPIICAMISTLTPFFFVIADAEEMPASFNASEARAVIGALDRDQNFLASYQACPGDIFRKEISLGRLLVGEDADVTADFCGQHPSECFSACSTKRSGEHCYRLALVFQDNQSVAQPRYAQMMFQMACALGKASGCTNRAAHLRNAADEGDPLTKLDEDARGKCEFLSFKVACDKNDNWGCAMLGQAYQNGEGVGKSAISARRSYEKSCRLNPDLAACAFSRAALKAMRQSSSRGR